MRRGADRGLGISSSAHCTAITGQHASVAGGDHTVRGDASTVHLSNAVRERGLSAQSCGRGDQTAQWGDASPPSLAPRARRSPTQRTVVAASPPSAQRERASGHGRSAAQHSGDRAHRCHFSSVPFTALYIDQSVARITAVFVSSPLLSSDGDAERRRAAQHSAVRETTAAVCPLSTLRGVPFARVVGGR